MQLEYDPQADAASVLMGGIIVPGGDHYKEPLDADRFVRYDSDDEILEYEFLNVRRYCVRLDDLVHRDALSRLFRDAGIQERNWSTPWESGRRIKRPPGGWPQRGPVPGRR
jgi:hypothetical protein